MSDVYIDYDDD